jgi:AraC family transcriptional activator of tynA and feaB
MEILFSTSDVHPRDRFDYWHEVACQTLVKHDSKPECRSTFQASLKTGLLADVGLVMFDNSPMNVVRTKHQITRATTDALFVCRQFSGVLALEQNGNEAVLEAGDFTLLDPLLPYSGKFSIGSHLLVATIPRRALEARLGPIQKIVGRLIKPSGAESDLTSSFLAMLPAYIGRIGPAVEEIVRNQFLDLLAISMIKVTGANRSKVSSAHSLALLTLRAAIEARLTDPTLDPNTVASAAGFSVRYANAVLAREGTSIMRLAQARRLMHCRKALEDPFQEHRTLSQIAFGWGFTDMTHFSRRFKAAYGVLPSEYRRSIREAAQAKV